MPRKGVEGAVCRAGTLFDFHGAQSVKSVADVLCSLFKRRCLGWARHFLGLLDSSGFFPAICHPFAARVEISAGLLRFPPIPTGILLSPLPDLPPRKRKDRQSRRCACRFGKTVPTPPGWECTEHSWRNSWSPTRYVSRGCKAEDVCSAWTYPPVWFCSCFYGEQPTAPLLGDDYGWVIFRFKKAFPCRCSERGA